MKRFLVSAAVLLGAACFSVGAAESGIGDVESLMRIAPSRHMGSEHRQALDQHVASRFEKAAAQYNNSATVAGGDAERKSEWGRITFNTPAFKPGVAELRAADGTRIKLRSVAPNSGHPGNLPRETWSGRLVDLGDGTPDEMRGASAMDAAVLLDMDSHRAWVAALELGAQVVIFAGSENDTNLQAADKLYPVPISVPRFYVSRDDASRLRKMMGTGRVMQVTLAQPQTNRWQMVNASNEWVVLWGIKHPEKVVHLQAYKDAASIVPELSHGAGSICNLALLLRMLDHYAANPPDYTLVFSAVSDHCNNLRGEQFFLASVYPEQVALQEEIDQRERDLAEAEFYAKVYSDRSPEAINRLRSEQGWVAGRKLFLKAPIFRNFSYILNRTRYNRAFVNDRLKQEELSPEKRAELEKEMADYTKRMDDLTDLMQLFRRWGGTARFESLSDVAKGQLLQAMVDLERSFHERTEDARSGLDEIKNNARLSQLLAGLTPHLYISLDLTFGNEKMGFFFQGSHRGTINNAETSVGPLSNLSVDLSRKMPDGERYFADTIRNTGGIGWRTHLAGKFFLASTVGAQLVVPAVTLATPGDARMKEYTPDDTLANLDADRVARMMEFAQRYLVTLMQEPGFRTCVRPPRNRNYLAITFRYNLRRMDPYSIEVPSDPVRNAVVVASTMRLIDIPPAVSGQVLTYQLSMTDRQGAALFRAHPAAPTTIEGFGFTDDFRAINAALDAGSGARRIPPEVTGRANRWTWSNNLALMFDCVQTDLVGLYRFDTRERVEKLILLDGERESSPDHYGISGFLEGRTKFAANQGVEGIGCLFTEPRMPIKIISDSFLLINMLDSKEATDMGMGYRPGDKRLRTIAYTSAQDIQLLNRHRMQRIAEKGVTNQAATQLYASASGLLSEAEEAGAKGDQRQFLGKAVEGLSNAYRSYDLVKTATSDLIKAVAVFLALVIPFCMFLTKLLSPWTDIRAQLITFGVIFGMMALGLALLHPAFSLSQTPMMVLLAFVMVGLAVFVMLILHNRFDAGLQQIVEETQGVEASEGSRKMLAGVAFNVGVNNMRRRRIRTSLTAATIVLVTFTMLSVISVGQSLSPYRRRTQPKAPYSGVLFAKAGMAPIPMATINHVSALFAQYGPVVKRTWTQRLDTYGGYMPLPVYLPENPASALSMKTVMGVEVAENGFTGPMPIVAGRWIRDNAAREILLSVEAAQVIGITPENFSERDVILRNDRVRLVGLLDDTRLVDMKDLAGLPFLPLESLPDPVSHQVSETGQMNVSADEAKSGPAPAARPVRASDCVLAGIEYARTLPDTSYRSIAVKSTDAVHAWNAANQFVSATGTLTYLGLDSDVTVEGDTTVREGQYSLGAPVGASVGGASKVVIPICLAATIILNTMLGTVMERRKEIAVYNSIGLNPTHVFVFFVAEAVVFGLIGSVAGYLIGQGLAQAIVHFGLLPGVNLNYSSMAVMVVIFAAIVTVIVSTLYPAFIATRAAVPSGQRRWKLPPPNGDELHLDFPFSYAESQLLGVMAFLHAFMDLNSEASSGQFLAQDARFGYVLDRDGRKVLTMVYSITPVPFDLGVNQRMEIYGYYQPKVRAYVIGVYVTRIKGDKNSWLTVNQPFMESLRARLLNWRSQSAANQEQFRIQGEAMFATATEFPVKGTGA